MILSLRCTDFCVAVFRATNSGCSEPNPVQRDLGSYRFSPLPDRNGRKLVDDWGGTTRGSFPTDCTPVECVSRTIKSLPPDQSQKLPCTATAAQRTREIFTNQSGGCRAGKFGEMREVWREKDTLRKGVLLPPRSSYPFLRTYLRTKATARRASGIRIAKTMIQTTKTVTETFRRADGRTCDSPIGYCRSSPASHERIAAV